MHPYSFVIAQFYFAIVCPSRTRRDHGSPWDLGSSKIAPHRVRPKTGACRDPIIGALEGLYRAPIGTLLGYYQFIFTEIINIHCCINLFNSVAYFYHVTSCNISSDYFTTQK